MHKIIVNEILDKHFITFDPDLGLISNIKGQSPSTVCNY